MLPAGKNLYFFRKKVYKPKILCYTMGEFCEGGASDLEGRSAVVFLVDDRYRTGSEIPLMLHPVLGVPVLQWLTHALRRAEVSRFFLACAPSFTEAAKACFPSDAELTTASDEDPADSLHVFLSTAADAEESLLVVTGPVLYLPHIRHLESVSGANACMVSRQALMAALDEDAPLGRFLKRSADACTQEDGFFNLYSPDDLPDWQGPMTQSLLRCLIRDGVQVWDVHNTYVTPGVEIGIGTSLLPGTVLEGKTVVGYGCTIGPNTRIIDSKIGNHAVVEQSRVEQSQVGVSAHVGPFANLRPGTVLDARVKAGAFVELKNASLAADVQVAHLSYLGDASVGERTNIGCGTVTANFDRVEKLPTVIEKDAFIGCNTTLVAPVTVGQGAYIGAGSVITEDIPAQALGIGRSRQTVRREWALRNKKPE